MQRDPEPDGGKYRPVGVSCPLGAEQTHCSPRAGPSGSLLSARHTSSLRLPFSLKLVVV